MLNNDYAQLARDRRQVHEDYIAERTLVSTLLSPRTLTLSGSLVLLFIAILGFFFASGCAPSTALAAESIAAEAPDDINTVTLTGRYRVYDTAYPSTIEFGADGRFSRATSANNLETAPVDQGSWRIEGDELVLVSDEAVSNCGAGRTGRYRLSEYKEGGILFQRLSEECEARTGFVPTATSQPIQPTGVFCELDTGELCARP